MLLASMKDLKVFSCTRWDQVHVFFHFSMSDAYPCIASDTARLQEYTRRVEVSTVAYNQNYGLLSFVSVNFFINKGGQVHKLLMLSCMLHHVIAGAWRSFPRLR